MLPEFDALMCGYDPAARDRFAEPDHLRPAWNQSNGMVLPPLLVDGRITGYWRATGLGEEAAARGGVVRGHPQARMAELDEPVGSPETRSTSRSPR